MYETQTQVDQQATNRQQADNEMRKRRQANMAQQGQYPYAQQGSQEAQATGAASQGAQQVNAQRALDQQQKMPPTFAQLQQAGYARPAPPPPPQPGTPQSAGMGPNGQAPAGALHGMMTQQQYDAGRQQWLASGGAQAEAAAPPPMPGAYVQPGMPSTGTSVPNAGMPPAPAAPNAQSPQATAPQAPQTWTTPGNAQLQQALSQMLVNPNAYRTQDTLDAYSQLGQQIDDQFAQQRTGINEEMARRGLYDSTIAGGRLYDSSVAQKAAKTQLAESLGRSQAEQENQARQAALGLGLQDQGQRFQQALGLGGLDVQQQNLALNRDQLGLDDAYRNRALDQNASQFAQNFGEGQRQFDAGQDYSYSALQQNGMLGLAQMLGLDVTQYGGPGVATTGSPITDYLGY